MSDYYGIAAWGYLYAVHRYLNTVDLMRYSFSTVAYRAMLQRVQQYRRRLHQRSNSDNLISLDTGGIDGAPLLNSAMPIAEQSAYKELEEIILLHSLAKELNPTQTEVVRLRLQGYGIHEVAKKLHVSDKRIRKLLRQIRKVFAEMCRP